jgi:hypothetical protein
MRVHQKIVEDNKSNLERSSIRIAEVGVEIEETPKSLQRV